MKLPREPTFSSSETRVDQMPKPFSVSGESAKWQLSSCFRERFLYGQVHMEQAGNFKAEASTNGQSWDSGVFGDWGEENCISAAPRIQDAACSGLNTSVSSCL